MAAGPKFADYGAKLRSAGVEFDPGRRRERVRNSIIELLEVSGGHLVRDEELEDWVVNSTEWPRALLGPNYVTLPRAGPRG